MDGEKDDQNTSKGRVLSKDTRDEYKEIKPGAVKAIDKKKWEVSYSWKT